MVFSVINTTVLEPIFVLILCLAIICKGTKRGLFTTPVEPYNVTRRKFNQLHFTAPYNVTGYILRRLVTLYGHSVNV